MKGKILALLFLVTTVRAQEVRVTTLEELFDLAKTRNIALQNAALQRDLALITRKIAGINAFSPRIPVSWQGLNNIALQRTYVPGTIFGQPEGTYKELVMGREYAATFNLSPQFDILNFGNLAQRKAADLHAELAHFSEKEAERNLFLDINSAYHNVVSYDRQSEILRQNLAIAKKILGIVQHRFEEGVARSQEVNEAEVNVLTLEGNLVQLEQNRSLQVELLKVLTRTDVLIASAGAAEQSVSGGAQSTFDTDLARLRWRIAAQDAQVARRDQWPVLSAVSSFNWQNLGSRFFYGPENNAIYFAYIGLKFAWELPTNVQKISNLKNKTVQEKIAENNLLLAEDQEEYAYLQRATGLEKARLELATQGKIELLKKDTFEKNYAQFEEHILALDKLLVAQADWLSSSLNRAAGAVTVEYNRQILKINNRY